MIVPLLQMRKWRQGWGEAGNFPKFAELKCGQRTRSFFSGS